MFANVSGIVPTLSISMLSFLIHTFSGQRKQSHTKHFTFSLGFSLHHEKCIFLFCVDDSLRFYYDLCAFHSVLFCFLCLTQRQSFDKWIFEPSFERHVNFTLPLCSVYLRLANSIYIFSEFSGFTFKHFDFISSIRKPTHRFTSTNDIAFMVFIFAFMLSIDVTLM